ncbi:MAG: gamma-glutamylcyclotransferase, partial [Kiloniellales bacterium]|nr:gamma-glutamylcyclotransferase [Kiloniellales bacterium]
PERPGLGLGLRPGPGSCRGRAYLLTQPCLEEGLEAIWEREMVTGIYRPVWVSLEGPKGVFQALTFIVEEEHPQFAGDLPLARQAEIIASAAGERGSCRDYLAETVADLKAAGFPDRKLEALYREVLRFKG